MTSAAFDEGNMWIWVGPGEPGLTGSAKRKSYGHDLFLDSGAPISVVFSKEKTPKYHDQFMLDHASQESNV